jgi:hypothetical protein
MQAIYACHWCAHSGPDSRRVRASWTLWLLFIFKKIKMIYLKLWV